LISPQEVSFITDSRYIGQAKKIRGVRLEEIKGSLFSLVADLSRKLGIKRLGFEAKHLSFAQYQRIRKCLSSGIRFVATSDFIEEFRQIKTPKEITLIKQATSLTLQALEQASRIIRPHMQERQLALALEVYLKNKGVNLSFEIIVASGANSAFPHHRPGHRRFLKNDIVLVDIGAEVEGYKSDLTRVFFLGKMPCIFKEVLNIVVCAQKKAIEAIRPGLPINKLDRIARQYIAGKGYARFFIHNLGHGIGLDIHEIPHIYSKNEHRLAEGMIFSIEPAIYLPGRFGVRIEDLVLVTKTGFEVISGT
jgi:Xaa-Pro aminopeptidase